MCLELRHKHTHSADGEGEPRGSRAHAHEAEAQLPVEQMFTDEGDERQNHGGSQHVENSCHVVHIQLAAHNLILLIVADARQPQGLQLLHLTYRNTGEGEILHICCWCEDRFARQVSIYRKLGHM